jgi:hypothetical protein
VPCFHLRFAFPTGRRDLTVSLEVNGTATGSATSNVRTVKDNTASLQLDLSPAAKLWLGVYGNAPREDFYFTGLQCFG